VNPVCALISGLRAAALRRLASETPRGGSVCEATTAQTIEVWAVLRHCVPTRGLHPLAPLCGYHLRARHLRTVLENRSQTASLKTPNL